MELNQTAKCSMKRRWVKSALGLNVLENPIATFHMGPEFKVSGSKFALFSKRKMNM
jgi:hypothetical protein